MAAEVSPIDHPARLQSRTPVSVRLPIARPPCPPAPSRYRHATRYAAKILIPPRPAPEEESDETRRCCRERPTNRHNVSLSPPPRRRHDPPYRNPKVASLRILSTGSPPCPKSGIRPLIPAENARRPRRPIASFLVDLLPGRCSYHPCPTRNRSSRIPTQEHPLNQNTASQRILADY